MYLKHLELQGFKTFAQKTLLEFVPDRAGRRGITAVVGPNGSGKSNIADALRWVMGEQSLKLLRGKKSEDVVFSGSDRRARSGFAEVTLILENDDKKSNVDFSEIAITRRLYRDGQSEYEVNRQAARLQDVALLLAQCGIAQRSYSVIGQGMVDQVLVASPVERKEFFDEAFGLRPFQLKRQNALHKMDEARKNLTQTEGLLREIEPRLTTLSRQMKRLQERERLETELKILERSFYGHGWQEISQGLEATQLKVKQAKIEEAKLEADAKKLETDLVALEKAGPVSEQFRVLRKALDELMGKRTELRERQMKLETQAAVAAARAEQPWTPLPLSKIIASVDTIREKHEALDRLLAAATLDVEALKKLVTELKLMSSKLVTQLQQPAAEPAKKDEKIDPVLKKEALEIAQALSQLADQMSEAQKKMETWNQEEAGERKHIFALQHELNQKRQTAQAAERRASDASIELARFETRREGFLNDLRQHAPAFEQGLDVLVKEINASILSEDASARLQKLRSQLEWIGGIDPETEKEFKETQTRYEFLAAQTKDLRESLEGLALVVQELDATIGERSEKAFRKLDHEFGIFFKKLFNGGEAKLIELVPEPKDKEVDEEQEGEIDEDEEEMAQGFSGIEIQATPPGKRFKAIALLSGGERALTSIALICAIMATNPSPFVVLDEVDAALDESNSRKFAEIINSLADQTQFIVISHNRATMAQANVLYGVTMGDDGVSQLLSVKLEDVEKLRQK